METNGISLHYHKKTKMWCISRFISCECGNHIERIIEYSNSNWEEFEKELYKRFKGILINLRQLKR